MEQPVDIFEADPATLQDFSPFYFTEMPQLDPFKMFDPGFDLNGADTCFEGNLDLGAPMGLPY